MDWLISFKEFFGDRLNQAINLSSDIGITSYDGICVTINLSSFCIDFSITYTFVLILT